MADELMYVKCMLLAVGVVLAVLCQPAEILAEDSYRAVIEDDAGLFSQEERAALEKQMQALVVYGNVGCKTIGHNGFSTESYAKSCFWKWFEDESGILLLIDLDNRQAWVHCDGRIYRTIGKKQVDALAGTVNRQAEKENYYACASVCFQQAFELLEGERLGQPVKYICNGLLALICGLLINFVLVNLLSRTQEISSEEILDDTVNYCDCSEPLIEFDKQLKLYNPQSNSRNYL